MKSRISKISPKEQKAFWFYNRFILCGAVDWKLWLSVIKTKEIIVMPTGLMEQLETGK